MRKPKNYIKPLQHQEERKNVFLRREDIQDMVKSGEIKSQHFLIQILAENMQESNDAV